MSKHSAQSKNPLATGPGMLWVLWMTYGAFYFCRTNISAAVPGIEAELELSKTEIGLILGSLKLTYGIGQFVNGQLAEHISSRKLLTVGMLASAGLNVVFGFGTALYFLVFVWAANGYFQALGWTPCMKVTSNWYQVSERGRAVGIIGTGYQATAALTFVVAGFSAQWFGWRGALYVPAGLFALACVHMLLFLEEKPPKSRGTEPGSAAAKPRPMKGINWRSLRENIWLTISHPALWCLAMALGLLNACRYGFLDWGIAFLIDTQGGSIGKSALKYALLPVGGIAGSVVAGWLSDRVFNGRRAPVIVLLLGVLGVLTLVYHRAVVAQTGLGMFLLVCIGFCVYGPQVLLVGTAPMDLARMGRGAAAVGFVNFMGYMGAFSGDFMTGRLVDTLGWQAALYFWAGCAFGAAVLSAALWRARPDKSNAS